MKGERGARTSADYQREFRERMRNLGLVKKDVWIRPEYAAELSAIEKRMREPRGVASVRGDGADGFSTGWSIDALHAALGEIAPVRSGAMLLERIEGGEPSLRLVMQEYGGLPLFIAVGGEQIVVETLMWPCEEVQDPAAFNAHVLRTHKVLPLSTLGIEKIDGVSYYTLFGSLDTHSSLANIVFEIETVAANAIGATQAYAEFLREPWRLALEDIA